MDYPKFNDHMFSLNERIIGIYSDIQHAKVTYSYSILLNDKVTYF